MPKTVKYEKLMSMRQTFLLFVARKLEINVSSDYFLL